MWIRAFTSLLVDYIHSERPVCMYNVFFINLQSAPKCWLCLLYYCFNWVWRKITCYAACVIRIFLSLVISPFEDMHTLLMLLTLTQDTGSSSVFVLQMRNTRRAMEREKLFKAPQSLYEGTRIWILALEHTIICVEHKYRVFCEFQKFTLRVWNIIL